MFTLHRIPLSATKALRSFSSSAPLLQATAYFPTSGSGLHLDLGGSSAFAARTTLFDVFHPDTSDLKAFDSSGATAGDHDKLKELISSLKSSEVEPPSTPEADALISIIEDYYANHAKIVGMGENDEGVTFSGLVGDPLTSLDLIEEVCSSIKQSRHGVRFWANTSGLTTEISEVREGKLKAIGLKGVEVYLPGANPKAFAANCGALENGMTPAQAFGRLCEFIVEAVEAGTTVNVRVRTGDKDSAKLAKGLGALTISSN
jgi:hypothetical protein